jgi:hypothetical protein
MNGMFLFSALTYPKKSQHALYCLRLTVRNVIYQGRTASKLQCTNGPLAST